MGADAHFSRARVERTNLHKRLPIWAIEARSASGSVSRYACISRSAELGTPAASLLTGGTSFAADCIIPHGIAGGNFVPISFMHRGSRLT